MSGDSWFEFMEFIDVVLGKVVREIKIAADLLQYNDIVIILAPMIQLRCAHMIRYIIFSYEETIF